MANINKNNSQFIGIDSNEQPITPTNTVVKNIGNLKFLKSDKLPKIGPNIATIIVTIEAVYPQ